MDEHGPDAYAIRRAASVLGINEEGSFLRNNWRPIHAEYEPLRMAPINPPTLHHARQGRLRARDFISSYGERAPGQSAHIMHMFSMTELYERMNSMWASDPKQWQFCCFACSTPVPFERVGAGDRETVLRGWSMCHICYSSPMCAHCTAELRDDLPCRHCVAAMRVVTLPARVTGDSTAQVSWRGRPAEWTTNFKHAVQLRLYLFYRQLLLQRPVPRRHPSIRCRLGLP